MNYIKSLFLTIMLAVSSFTIYAMEQEQARGNKRKAEDSSEQSETKKPTHESSVLKSLLANGAGRDLLNYMTPVLCSDPQLDNIKTEIFKQAKGHIPPTKVTQMLTPIVAWSNDLKIILKDFKDIVDINANIIATLPEPYYNYPVTFSPNGAYLAYVTEDKDGQEYIRIFNIQSKSIECSLKGIAEYGGQYEIFSWSPNSRYLAAGADDYGDNVDIFDIQSREQIAAIPNNFFYCYAWSSDSTYLALGTERSAELGDIDSDDEEAQKEKVEIWHIPEQRKIAEIDHVRYHVYSLAWSPNNEMLAIGAYRNPGIWHIKNQEYIPLPTWYQNTSIEQIIWSPDSRFFATLPFKPSFRHDNEDKQGIQVWTADAKPLFCFNDKSYSKIMWDTAQPNSKIVWLPDGTIIAEYKEGNFNILRQFNMNPLIEVSKHLNHKLTFNEYMLLKFIAALPENHSLQLTQTTQRTYNRFANANPIIKKTLQKYVTPHWQHQIWNDILDLIKIKKQFN